MFWKRKETRSLTFDLNVRFGTDVLAGGYEQTVAALLREMGAGKLAGHGALLAPDRTEVLSADFSVELTNWDAGTVAKLVDALEEDGAPLGSYWHFDDTPDTRHPFGTLDGLTVTFDDLDPEIHAAFETYLHEVIDRFHARHAKTAGFQGGFFSARKVVASFHGFEFDDMKAGLEEVMVEAGNRFAWRIDRTTE